MTNKTERRLYAVRKGAPDWAEQLITEDETRIEAAREWAKNNGFDRFRVATFTPGELPDFTAGINRK